MDVDQSHNSCSSPAVEQIRLLDGQTIETTQQNSVGSTREDEERNLQKSFILKLKENLLLLLTGCGVILGFGLGFGVRSYNLSGSGLMWLGLPGEVFMRMLMVTILPLIVSSIIAGTASLDPKSNGKISMIALVYYISSNAVGVLVGIVMFYILRPDRYVETNQETNDLEKATVKLETEDIFADLIRNLFPDNLVTACFQKAQTSYLDNEAVFERNGTNFSIQIFTRSVGTASGTNILGLIILCSILGIATGKLGEAGRPFVLFFKACSDIIIMVLRWFVWFTPVGVASLISTSIAKAENLEATLISIAMFVLMVALMVLSIVLLIIPIVYFVTLRQNPFFFLYTAFSPVMTAIAPPSAAIAMPDILMTVEGKHAVDARISRFAVPFGVAISRCGSGAFIIMCSLFLSYIDGIALQHGQVVSIAILTLLSTLAIPSIPSGSIIAVIIILSSINVTPAYIGIIMSLEWLTDRLRTIVNVMPTIYGSILINKLCERDLPDTSDYNVDMCRIVNLPEKKAINR